MSSRSCVVWLGAAIFALSPAFAFSQTASPSAEALKYHTMLRRRPQPGVVFDRFTSAWLASGSRESLKDFLTQKAQATEATAADDLILALFHSTTGGDAEALKACEKAAAKTPDDPQLHLRTAEIANRLKQWDTALTALTRAAKIGLEGESDIRATRLQSDILWRLGRTAEAKSVFRKLIERHSEELSLREELVDMLVENGLKPEAMEESRALVDLTKDPFDKAMRRLRLADLLLDARKTPLARTELELSLAQSGTDSWLEGEALDRMERLHRRSGDVSGFAARLAELTKEHPNRVAITRREMRILNELARPADASALAAALLQRTPGRRDVREDYITLLEAQGNIREAIVQMEELLRQEPNDGELMLRLAGLHGRNNSPVRTRELIDLFLKQSPDDEGALMQAGRVLEQHSLEDAARELYEKWMSAHPQDPFAGLSLAALLHRQGDIAGAVKLWRRLAAQGDIATASQVAASAANRGEVLTAFEVLNAREKELLDDPRLLIQICNLALQARQDASCTRWLRRYAQLVKDAGELQRLAALTSSVLNRKQARGQLLDDFVKYPPAGTGDFILQAFAHEFTPARSAYEEEQAGRRNADQLLTQAWNALPHPADAPLSAEEGLLEAARVQVLTRRRDWTGVLRILGATISRPGGKTSTRLQSLAEASIAALNYEDALRWISEWKAVAPGSHASWRVHAAMLRSLGRTEEMLSVLREAAQRFHDQEEMSLELAAALSNAGQATEAVAVYRRIFEEKDEPAHRLRIGRQMVRAAKGGNQLNALLDEWKRYQREHADSPEPWRLIAMAYSEKPDVEAYCHALGEALRLAPNDIGLMRELAMCEDARGNTEKAAQLYREAARRESTPQANRAYAEFLLKRGETSEALQIMREMASAQTTTATEIEELADNLLAMRMWEETAVLLEEPSRNHARNARLLYQRGVALEECGKLEEAARHFMRMLQIEQEMVDATPLPPLRDALLLPEMAGAGLWRRFHERGNLAYVYRGLTPHHERTPLDARGGPARKVLLPQCQEEAQVFALRHLVRLAEVAHATSSLRAPIQLPGDVPMATMWTELRIRQSGGAFKVYTSMEQVRAHPVLLTDWLRGAVGVTDLPEHGGTELLLHAERTFSQTHPGLAAEATLLRLATVSPEEAGACLDRALEMAGRSTASKERLALLANSIIGDAPVAMTLGTLDHSSLSAQHKERLLAALTTWAKEAAASDASAGAILSHAASALSARGHWTEWRALLDEAVPRIRENRAALSAQAEVREIGTFHNILPFPSSIYSGHGLVPTRCLHQKDGWRGEATDERAPATLADQAKDPLTKLLCLHAAARTSELKQEAIRLAQVHPRREDVLFLKASVLANDGDSAELTDALRQWATLPVPDELQRSRARHVMDLTLDAGIPPDDAMQAAVQAAAKHLVALGTLEDRRSGGTVEALKTAGYEAAGQMLAGSVVHINTYPRITAQQLTGPLTVRSAQDLMNRAGSISDDGASLRLFTDTLRKFANDEISQARGPIPTRSDDGWGWLANRLHQRQAFRDSVLAHLLSEAGSPRLRHEEAAFMFERLSYSSRHSKEHYLKALEQNPANTHVRLRAVCLLVDGDPQQAQKLYESAPLEDRVFIGHSLCQRSEQGGLMLTQLVSRFATGILHSAAARKSVTRDLDWIDSLVNELPWSQLGNLGSGIGDLLHEEPAALDAGFGSASANDAAAAANNALMSSYELRRELESLCEAALGVPEFAASAFSTYAALQFKKGVSVESLAPKAREALQAYARYGGWARTGFFPSTGPACVWQPSPMALLALHASRQPDAETAFRELAAFAQSCKVQHAGRLVAALQELYTCTEAEFPAAARALERLPFTVGYCWLDLLPATTVARVWKERGLSMDPAPLMLSYFGADSSYAPYTASLGMIIETYARRGQREEAKAFLVKVMEQTLGPRRGWSEFVKSLGDDYRDPRASSITFIHQLMQHLSETDPVLTFMSLNLAEEARLRLHPSFRAEYLVPSWMRGIPSPVAFTRHPSARVLHFLAASPWLKPGAPLWDCPLHSGDKKTVLTHLTGAIHQMSRADQNNIHLTLERAAAQNPGAAVLQALLTSDQQKLVDAIALADATIKDAPACAVEALGMVMDAELAPIQKATVKARSPQLHALLQQVEEAQAARAAEAFFTARTVESLHMEDSQFEDTMRRAATRLAETDRAKAVKLLDRACELIVEKQRREGWTGSTGLNGWTACGQALKVWCDNTTSLDVVAVACDLFHQPDEFNAVSSGWWNRPSWGGALLMTWKDEGGLGNPEAGLRGLLRALHSKLAIKKAPLLIPAFMDFHLKLDPWQQLEVERAAEGMVRENSELSLYASWVQLAGRLNNLTNGAFVVPGSQEPEMIKAINEGFRAIITDESVNPLVRLQVGDNFLRLAGAHADAETIWAAMDLAMLVLEKEWPAHGYLMLYVLKELNRLPVDERYKAAASRWLPAWLHRNRYTGTYSRHGLSYDPVDVYQSAVLTLAARGVDDAGLRQTLRSLSNPQQRSSTNLLLLIRHDRHVVAREVFMQFKDQLLRGSHNNVQPEDADMPKLRAFAETLPNADLRLQLMVYCTSFYGLGMLPEQWADSRALPWNRRMAEQARAVMQHNFQDLALKEKLMMELADAPAAVVEMKQELKEKDLRDLVRNASFGSGSASVWESLRYPMEVTLSVLAEEIRRTPPAALAEPGSVFPGPLPSPLSQVQLDFQTLLERVDSGRDSRPKAECMRQIEGNLFESTMLTAPSMEGTSLAGFLPSWNKILRAYSSEKERFEEEALGVATQIVLAGLSGKLGEIQSWREDVPHYRRDALLAKFIEHRHLMTVAQQLCRTEAGGWRKFEERWKLVQAFAGDPWVLEYLKSSRDVVSQFVRNNVLTIEEALAHGGELAAMFPDDGRVAAELAALMKLHGRDDDVPKLLALAMEQARDNDTWHAEWGLRLMRWHAEHQQREKAVKVWESLESRQPEVKQPDLKKALDAARSVF